MPYVDVIDLAPILREQRLEKKRKEKAAYDSDDLEWNDPIQDKIDAAKWEKELRAQLIKGTNDGMQRQMNERFIDREVIRQKQTEYIKLSNKKERHEEY